MCRSAAGTPAPARSIIPKQFEQIKSTIKRMIMDTFFEPQFLEKQLKEKLSGLADDKFVKEKLQMILDSPEFEKVGGGPNPGP